MYSHIFIYCVLSRSHSPNVCVLDCILYDCELLLLLLSCKCTYEYPAAVVAAMASNGSTLVQFSYLWICACVAGTETIVGHFTMIFNAWRVLLFFFFCCDTHTLSLTESRSKALSLSFFLLVIKTIHSFLFLHSPLSSSISRIRVFFFFLFIFFSSFFFYTILRHHFLPI